MSGNIYICTIHTFFYICESLKLLKFACVVEAAVNIPMLYVYPRKSMYVEEFLKIINETIFESCGADPFTLHVSM